MSITRAFDLSGSGALLYSVVSWRQVVTNKRFEYGHQEGCHADDFQTPILASRLMMLSSVMRTSREQRQESLRLNAQFSLEAVYPPVGPKGAVLAQQSRWSADLRKAALK
jgi:hypothetical protein